MNENLQVCGALLRNTLFQEPFVLFERTNWAEVFKLLRLQGVEPLVSSLAEIIKAVPLTVWEYLKKTAERQVFEYYRFLSAEDELATLLHGDEFPLCA